MPRGERCDDRDLGSRDQPFLIRRPPPRILRSAAINLQSAGAAQAAADQQKIVRVSHNHQIAPAPGHELPAKPAPNSGNDLVNLLLFTTLFSKKTKKITVGTQ